jgi:hypothetical protein
MVAMTANDIAAAAAMLAKRCPSLRGVLETADVMYMADCDHFFSVLSR